MPATNRKIVRMLPIDEITTISPAKFPLPPIDWAIGVDETAVGDANTAKSATNASCLKPRAIDIATASAGTTTKRQTTVTKRYLVWLIMLFKERRPPRVTKANGVAIFPSVVNGILKISGIGTPSKLKIAPKIPASTKGF